MFDLAPSAQPDLERFWALMRASPLCVVIDERRALLRAVQLSADKRRLVPFPAWEVKNWAAMMEASALFWRDPVWGWAETHPCATTGLHYRSMDRDGPDPAGLVVDIPWLDSCYETGESCDFLGEW